VAVVGGMLAGVLLFAEAFPLLARFYDSTPRGTLTFPGLLHISPAVATAALVALALGMFAAAERWEHRAHAGGGS
jgi:hypothetical protein